MNDYGIAVLLGIVEGLTEFLPVSSTGHLLVTENLLGLTDTKWEAFTVVIQLGAVLAVVAVYWRKFWDVLVGLPGERKARQFAINIIVAFLPAAVLGALLIKYINAYLLDPARAIPVIGASWLIGGNHHSDIRANRPGSALGGNRQSSPLESVSDRALPVRGADSGRVALRGDNSWR